MRFVLFSISMMVAASAFSQGLVFELDKVERILIEGGKMYLNTKPDEVPSPSPPPIPTPPPPVDDKCVPTPGLTLVRRKIEGTLRSYLVRNAALVVEFNSGSDRTAINRINVGNHGMTPSAKLVSISECPGDFTSDKIADKCITGGGEISFPYVLNDTKFSTMFCSLKPNTKYYINVRNANLQTPLQDTCPSGKQCGYVFYIR